MATNENMDTTAGAGNEDERKLFAGGSPQDAKEAQIKMIDPDLGPLAKELANEDDESSEVQALIHEQNEVRYEVL